MGQIVSSAAKPKRCNLNQLSQLGTPAAGEYILVSSDNSMNAAGQGNFGCYIVGDGNKAANLLPLNSFAEILFNEKTIKSEITINTTWTNGAVYASDGTIGSSSTMDYSDYIDVALYAGKTVIYSRVGQTVSSSGFGIAFYNSSKTYISGENVVLNQSTLHYIPSPILVPATAAYIRVSRIRNTTTAGDFYMYAYKSLKDILSTENVPIKGSTNPISSGGMYDQLHLSQSILPTVEWSAGFVYYNNGTIFTTSSVQQYSSQIDISAYAGKEVVFSRAELTISTQAGCAFYTSAGVYISGIQNVGSAAAYGYKPYSVVVPSNAKWVRFTRLADTTTHGNFYLYQDRTVKELAGKSVLFEKQSLTIEEKAQAKENIGAGSVFSDISKSASWTPNYGVNYSSGNLVSMSSGSRSSYIDIHDYAGKVAIYSQMQLDVTSPSGIAFFDSLKNYISGVQCVQSAQERKYIQKVVPIPSNAYYVLCTKFTDADTYGKFYFSVDMSLETAFSDVYDYIDSKEKDGSQFTDDDCMNRFYTAMNEKCASYGITGQSIVSPAGYNSRASGNKHDTMNIYGVAKLVAIASGYPFMANIWSEDSHVIKTRNNVQTITVSSSFADSSYKDNLTDYYDILAWKTGTVGALTNLCVMATSDELEGNVLIGVLSRTYGDYTDSGDVEGNNRYLAMKYLIDIGKTLFLNRSADISALQTSLLAQDVTSAVVITIPRENPRLIHHIDIAGSSYYNIYSYNPGTITTMSMIKLLTAAVALDYIPDLDEHVEIESVDITNASGGSGAIFAAGEQITYRDLFYGMMLPSSNQAAYAIARYVGKYLLNNYDNTHFYPTP